MGKHRWREKIISFLLALIMISATLIEPLPVLAADEAYAVSEDGAQYTSVDAAWNAATAGKKIILQRNWEMGEKSLTLPDNKTATIEMNGYRIYSAYGPVFYAGKGSTLTFLGNNRPQTSINYRYTSITTGGLITCLNCDEDGAGVHMKEGSKLILDNVAIAGCYNAGYGGGVSINGDNCEVVMRNGAAITDNQCEKYGAGIYAYEEYFTLRMDNASISNNYAGPYGGGIYSGDRHCVIEMTNNSRIDSNSAEAGGGIYFNYPEFTLTSTDSTGSISKNRARKGSGGGYGGAIYTCQTGTSNEGSISGITFDGDSSFSHGGAIYLDQESITIANCKIVNCASGGNGGGIYNNNDKNTISSCTITGNKASEAGGGVYSDSLNDIALSGRVIIKDNKRDGDSSTDDDLYLQDGLASTAYIIGAPSGRSEIGIRTEGKTERVIGKEASFFYANAFFYDNDKDGKEYIIKYDEGASQLKIKKKSASDVTTTIEEVAPDTKVTENGYNGQDLLEGYFSYPSVVESDEDLDAKFYYSDGFFLNGDQDGDAGDPTQYNEHLATMSMSMALAGFYSNIGNDGSLESENRKYTYKSQNIEKLFTDIGVATDDIYISETQTVKPSIDSIGVAIGQKTITSGDEEYILVPIAMRGAGYEREWYGNTTVGTSGEHQGFATAANTVFELVQAYIKNYGLEDALSKGRIKFWIAGYSRGGAVSNLTAKRLIEAYACSQDNNDLAKSNQVYAYCFEAPKGGLNSEMQCEESAYYSIHNCINKVDIVPLVAPKEMGFIRYGVDHYVPGSAAETTVSSDTSNWSFVSGQSWASSYKTWHDNSSYTVDDTVTDKTNYGKQRALMLKQLASVDAENIYFYDRFRLATVNYVRTMIGYDMIDEIEPQKGSRMTQEDYLQIFCRALQSWGFYKGGEADFRKSYNEYVAERGGATVTFQTALQTLTKIFFSKSSEELDGMLSAVMANASSLDTTSIWRKCIGTWTDRTTAERKGWFDTFWNTLIEKKPVAGQSVASYLTDKEKSELHEAMNTLIDIVLRLVEVDYNNYVEDWNSSKALEGGATTKVTEGITNTNENYTDNYPWQVVVGTLANNVTALAQGHYPEINYAWLRSYDSFYTSNEANKTYQIVTDVVPSVTDQWTESSATLTLSTSTQGAGIYYRTRKSGDADYGDWKPYNKPITLTSDTSGDTTYEVQMTAVYCGNTSEVVTKTYTVGRSYSVKVNGEVVGSYRAGLAVEIDGTGTDTGKAFKAWTKAVSVKGEEIQDITLADMTDVVARFTMPEAEVELTADYVTRISSLTLTVDKPVANAAFAETGVLSWTGTDGGEKTATVPVLWKEIKEEGSRLVTGNADYGTAYAVVVSLASDLQKDLVFAYDLSQENVQVVYSGEAAQQAASASVDDKGKLQLEGNAIVTDKAKITQVPDLTLDVTDDTTEEALRALLPQSTVVMTQIGDRSLPLDLSNLDLSAFLVDGIVKTGGSFQIPLDLSSVTDLQAEEDKQSLKVVLNVHAKPVTAAPVIVTEGGTYNQKSLSIVMTCETEGSTIYYQVDGGSPRVYTEGSLVLTGEEGCKSSFYVTAWAESELGGKSTGTAAAYVLNNPFTLSIQGKDTGFKTEGLWDTPKTYSYYKGDKVVIVAPSEGGEQFEQWESLPEGVSGDKTSDTLTIDSLTGNVELTAIYNPIVAQLDLTMEAPTLGRELAESVTQAYATVEEQYDITKYIKKLVWNPGDTMPAYDTAYTAKLAFDSESQGSAMKYVLSDKLVVKVKDTSGEEVEVTARVSKEEGKEVLNITFPKTGKAKLISVGQPEDMGVSRDNAAAGNWNLPTETTLILSDATSVKTSITWNEEPVYDASDLNAQIRTITGSVAIPEYVDAGQVSTEVSLTVTIESAASVAVPVASLESGTYTDKQYVRLTCETEGASIYYTLDGSEPTAEESETCKLYQEGETITVLEGAATTTLKAIAVKEGLWTSGTAEYTYQKQDEEPTPTPTPDGQTTPTPTPDGTKPSITPDGQTPTATPTGSGNSGSKTSGSSKTSKNVNTGDTTNSLPWVLALVVCCGALGGLVVYRVKKKSKK